MRPSVDWRKLGQVGVEADPESAGAYLNRAFAYDDNGQPELALADFIAFRSLYPESDQFGLMADERIRILEETIE